MRTLSSSNSVEIALAQGLRAPPPPGEPDAVGEPELELLDEELEELEDEDELLELEDELLEDELEEEDELLLELELLDDDELLLELLEALMYSSAPIS